MDLSSFSPDTQDTHFFAREMWLRACRGLHGRASTEREQSHREHQEGEGDRIRRMTVPISFSDLPPHPKFITGKRFTVLCVTFRQRQQENSSQSLFRNAGPRLPLLVTQPGCVITIEKVELTNCLAFWPWGFSAGSQEGGFIPAESVEASLNFAAASPSGT